mmetsp:Transcript_40988/g.67907  ORF Transcript_40988/g.67907 Transcript_40988/m.67907 type:complete len:80 (-) Transcript_40988:386-625(-)
MEDSPGPLPSASPGSAAADSDVRLRLGAPTSTSPVAQPGRTLRYRSQSPQGFDTEAVMWWQVRIIAAMKNCKSFVQSSR